jgi:hypothetical protein
MFSVKRVMRKITIIFLAAMAVIACGNSNTSDQASDSRDTVIGDTGISNVNDTMALDTTVSGCYSLITGRDTASLQLQRRGTTATGSLSYNLYQKDRNDGTFQGELIGDRLVVWYMFRSEGVMSVRQEIFQVRPDKLWPAVGEVTVMNDTARFVNPDRLRFDSTRAFVKVKCEI